MGSIPRACPPSGGSTACPWPPPPRRRSRLPPPRQRSNAAPPTLSSTSSLTSLPLLRHLLNNRSMSRQLEYGRTYQGKMERGLEHLQPIVLGSGTSKSASTAPIQTKNDTKFEATKHLLLTALQLESAAIVLEEYIKVICNVESSCTLILKKSEKK